MAELPDGLTPMQVAAVLTWAAHRTDSTFPPDWDRVDVDVRRLVTLWLLREAWEVTG